MRKILLSVVITAALSIAASSEAANVNVRLKVASGTYLNTIAVCTVSVPQGSNGIAVLDAAKSIGCIRSYKLVTYPIGSFVDCINEVCGGSQPPYYFWAMRENAYAGSSKTPACTSTDYGVSDFSAAQGEELSFTYETLATSFVPGICPA